MRFRKGNAYGLELSAFATQLTSASGLGETVKDMPGKEFSGGVGALELGHFVEIAIIQGRQHRPQCIVCAAYIDNNAVAVEKSQQ